MLAAANLRTHWRSFLAALLATTFGVAVISATLIVYDSSRPVVQPRLEGADVLVLPAQADNEFGNESDLIPWSADGARQIAADLGGVPGAEAVVTDRSFYAQPFIDGVPIEDEGAQDAGHGWSSALLSPYRLTAGVAPANPDQVVVPSSLGPTAGESVTVNLAAGLKSFTVSGTMDGPGIYFTDDRAEQLDPGVRAIGIVAASDVRIDDLETTAEERLGDRGRVVTGIDRAALEPEFVSHRRNLGNQLIVAMSTIGLFTTVFVVGSTFSLATAERRREIGLLRTVGAATGQVRRMVLGEAAAIGLIGGLVGAALGVAAAPALRALLLNLDVQPPDFRIQISAWPLTLAVGIGIFVAVIGAWAAAGSATRVAPMEALLAAAVERRPMTPLRWTAALVALAGGSGATVLTTTAATDSRVNIAVGAAMLLILAAALLAPVVIGPISWTVTAPLASRFPSAAAMLVGAELTTGTRRAAATAAPVIAAVGFAVLLSGIVQTMAVAYPAQQTEQLRGLALVTPDGTAGLSDQVVAETGAGPVGTRAGLPTRVFVPGEHGGVTVVDAVGSLDERYAAPGRAVLDEATAGLLGAQSGETMSVTFADGKSESVVVWQVLPLDPARGPFVLPRDLVREHDPSALTDTVFVPQDRAPTHLTVGARVEDAYSFALQDYRVDARLTNWLAAVLIIMAVGYSGLAVANSMAMSAYRRRLDTAVLKMSGGTDRQLMSMAVGETAVVVLIGSALGLIVTVPPLLAMAAGLSRVTETQVGLQIEWSTVLGVIAGCFALASAATVAVTRRGLRTRSGTSSAV
ncbi:ABC transporter permease [Rhodococcus sp. 05-2254-6]|uniref:ABC transporter permease n=1 Tax=Rhodococcus sp. 05-2254-6 TaxID=2022489 RepID=UPI0015C5ABDB|nr:ABC transporter permease [Rhodococcus sp. 05-2254-6]